VHSLDKVLATRPPRDPSDNEGCEPLWAPLMDRSFDAFQLKQCTHRWARLASLGAGGATSNRALRTPNHRARASPSTGASGRAADALYSRRASRAWTVVMQTSWRLSLARLGC